MNEFELEKLITDLNRSFCLRKTFFAKITDIQNLIIEISETLLLTHPEVTMGDIWNDDAPHELDLVNSFRAAMKMRTKYLRDADKFTDTSIEISEDIARLYPDTPFALMMERLDNAKKSAFKFKTD